MHNNYPKVGIGKMRTNTWFVRFFKCLLNFRAYALHIRTINQYKIPYIKKKHIFFIRMNCYILLITSLWYRKSCLANFLVVWQLYPEILFLNLNLTVLHTLYSCYLDICLRCWLPPQPHSILSFLTMMWSLDTPIFR